MEIGKMLQVVEYFKYFVGQVYKQDLQLFLDNESTDVKVYFFKKHSDMWIEKTT